MIKKECSDCLSWDIGKNMCLRVAHGLACVVGEPPKRITFIPKPHTATTENRFLLWSHENLANFAKDMLAENVRLREKLEKIQSVLGV